MVKEIGVQQLLSALGETGKAPVLILDPSGVSETFFKYKSILVMAYNEREAIPSALKNRFMASVRTGGTLVLSIDEDKSPFDYFDADAFPEEVLDQSKLTEDFLSHFLESDDEWCSLHKDFRFVTLQKTHEIPDWAGAFEIIKITV